MRTLEIVEAELKIARLEYELLARATQSRVNPVEWPHPKAIQKPAPEPAPETQPEGLQERPSLAFFRVLRSNGVLCPEAVSVALAMREHIINGAKKRRFVHKPTKELIALGIEFNWFNEGNRAVTAADRYQLTPTSLYAAYFIITRHFMVEGKSKENVRHFILSNCRPLYQTAVEFRKKAADAGKSRLSQRETEVFTRKFVESWKKHTGVDQ